MEQQFPLTEDLSASPDVIVSARHLSKVYRHCVALNDVSFDVHQGDLIGLVGKNGAGKTTLIRLLTGVATPTKGAFSIFGAKDKKTIIQKLSKVAAMVETPALYENLTATQNLRTKCLLMGIEKDSDSYIRDKLEFVGLPESFLDKRKVKDYSLGMRQRVGIAMAMIGDPKLMILDEPTNGLDPEGIRQIRELLLKLNHEKDVTIIVSSHILSELEKFASTYIFIDKGRLIKEISAEELEANVGKVLVLKTSDNLKAFSLLKASWNDIEMVRDTVCVHDIKDSAAVINALSSAGISLVGMKQEENSLEDYFLNLIGGK